MNTTNISFATYKTARQYLEAFVQSSSFGNTPDLALERAKRLMAQLGNPQEQLPVIHLAGTSGKGSTATILAALLHAHGLKVGLGLSPHVRHLLERIQVNGAPVSEEEFCRVLSEMVPAIEAIQQSELGAPSFFEILIALSYKLFAQFAVDVVVMETGLGGRYDATNTVTNPNKIALFTDIGYDHVEVLGNTLSKIAAQKAGIIQPRNQVLTYLQAPDAQAVIAAESALQKAQLTTFDPAAAIHNLRLQPAQLYFDLILPGMPRLSNLRLSLAGAHQAQNAGLAIAAARLFLSTSGRSLDEVATRHALARINLPGRMDQRTWCGVQIILDGAHNPQKMNALCNALRALYPNQRFVFVVALKEGKDHSAILAQLLPLAAHLILTRFDNQDQGMPVHATDPHELATYLPDPSAPLPIMPISNVPIFNVPVSIAPDVADAMALAVDFAYQASAPGAETPPLPIVATGSIYLLAQLYAVIEGA